MLLALTTGEEKEDTFAVDGLSKIEAQFPEQDFTAFCSRYYLYVALRHRERTSEARDVASQAVAHYREDAAVTRLIAYQDLARYAVAWEEPPSE